jgi:hypothetical protein
MKHMENLRKSAKNDLQKKGRIMPKQAKGTSPAAANRQRADTCGGD